MKNLLNFNLRNPALFFTMICAGLTGIFPISMAQDKPWTTKAPMLTARSGLSANVVEGKIYAIGGATNSAGSGMLSSVEMYDPATSTWTAKAPMSTARFMHYSAVVNGIIYVFGGDGTNAKGTVEAYDPATDSWTNKSNMSSQRGAHRAVAVNGKIYVIGGTMPPNYPALKIVEEYDPATDTWTRKADMPIGKWCFATSVVDGIIYVIGGQSSGGSWSSTVHAYNPATDTWTQKTNMPTGRTHLSACAVNGIIFVIGGGTTSSVSLSTVEAYDPAADKWNTHHTPMPTSRCDFGIGTANGKIYIIGGTKSFGLKALKTVEEYTLHLDLLSLIEKIEVDKSYANSGTDSVCITTKMSDPTGITIMAHIEAHDQSPVDSLQLFDDGNHNDGNADDGLYANCWPVDPSEEPVYYVDLKVTRIDMDTVTNRFNNVTQFTTIGPVTLEGYPIASSDTVFDPGDRINIKLTLKNNDLATTAPNIEAKLTSLDTLVKVSAWSRPFGDIAPGESVTSDYYTVTISDEWSGNSQLPILVEISSNDYVYWKDTILIPVITDAYTIDDPGAHPFKLYPNPADNILNIEFSNSVRQEFEIEILTITSELISRKEYKNINAHFTEQIDLSNYAKGIYLVKVRQAHSVYVGKVIVR